MSRPKLSGVRVVPPLDARWRRLWPAPVVLLVGLAAAASAGEVKPKTAVLEFRAGVGGAPADLGVTVAQIVSDTLGATGRYEMVPQERVREACRKADLRPPFGVGHIQLVADVLGADIVVHGTVRALTFGPAAGAASVVLAAEVVDGKSGDLKKKAEATGRRAATAAVTSNEQQIIVDALAVGAENLVAALTGLKVTAPVPVSGASVTVTVAAPPSPPLLPATTPPLGDEPISSAPRLDLMPKVQVASKPPTDVAAGTGSTTPGQTRAATGAPAQTQPPAETNSGELAVQPIIEAKVLAKIASDRVLITLGKDALVAPKMEMDVYRITYPKGQDRPSRQKIGRIRIAKVSATDAEARILEGGPLIRTGDMAYYFGQ